MNIDDARGLETTFQHVFAEQNQAVVSAVLSAFMVLPMSWTMGHGCPAPASAQNALFFFAGHQAAMALMATRRRRQILSCARHPPLELRWTRTQGREVDADVRHTPSQRFPVAVRRGGRPRSVANGNSRSPAGPAVRVGNDHCPRRRSRANRPPGEAQASAERAAAENTGSDRRPSASNTSMNPRAAIKMNSYTCRWALCGHRRPLTAVARSCS